LLCRTALPSPPPSSTGGGIPRSQEKGKEETLRVRGDRSENQLGFGMGEKRGFPAFVAL
jgi:hypothetical protein